MLIEITAATVTVTALGAYMRWGVLPARAAFRIGLIAGRMQQRRRS